MAQSNRVIVNVSRFLGILSRPMCTFNRDVVKPAQVQDQDILLRNLKNVASTDGLLKIIETHNKIMNNKHTIQALRSIFNLQKSGNSNISTRDILVNPTFGKLCRQLKYHAGTIDIVDSIEAIKVISYIGVSSKSTIAETLFQLMKHNINQLNLHQIMFVDFLLGQFSPTPIIEALKIALPIVFEINLPKKMNYDNIAALTDYLQYVSKHRISSECTELIVTALMKFDGVEFDSKTAKSIIWSLCDMECNVLFKPLLKRSIQNLIVNLDDLSFLDMETTLSKLTSRYSKRYPFYYDEVFYDTCVNNVIDHDLGFKNASYILRKFARVDHNNNYLLEYASKKAFENPKVVEEANLIDIYSIVVALGLTDFRPTYWDNLKKLILQYEHVNSSRSEIIWIKFGASLCLLDCYKIDILNRCLSTDFLDQLFRKNFDSDIKHYLTIWQSIKLYKPELNCLLSKKYLPEDLVKKIKHDYGFPLEGALIKALGGENYVKTNVLTHFGCCIDHVVIFRKGEYPVAFNQQEVLYLEELEVPEENQLVLIQCLNPSDYTINNVQLKPSVNLGLKFLESKGYTVLSICLETWNDLPDFEKIPYIMQKLKEKLNCNISVKDFVY